MQVLLVNPMSSSAYLSARLKEFGIYSVALYTIKVESLSSYTKINPDLFDQQIYTGDNLSKIKELLASFSFDFILNGLDEGFTIFEEICNDLLPQFANEHDTLNKRVDKFAMQEALKVNGMPYIKQIKIKRDDICEKLINYIGYPCFIKPVNGAASVGATQCYSYAEINESIKRCKKSYIGSYINEFIVQEVITGTEIFVDIFSTNDKHYVSAVHTIIREDLNNTPCYRYELIITDKKIWDAATEFVKQALDVLGFKNGFTHTELFYCADGSFRLLEVNPRISGSGGLCNSLAEVNGLPSQVSLLNNYLCGIPLISATPDMINGHGVLLYLYNFSNQPNKELNLKLTSFPSIKQIVNLSVLGKMPDKIKDLTNVDCMVLLHHTDKEQLDKDKAAIFNLEAIGKLL